MQNAIVRINELQEEIKVQSKSIEGAQTYIEQQVKLYKQDEALRKQFKSLEKEGQKIANDFFKQHSSMIDTAAKNAQKQMQEIQERFDV
jgi:hypothetical protein